MFSHINEGMGGRDYVYIFLGEGWLLMSFIKGLAMDVISVETISPCYAEAESGR